MMMNWRRAISQQKTLRRRVLRHRLRIHGIFAAPGLMPSWWLGPAWLVTCTGPPLRPSALPRKVPAQEPAEKHRAMTPRSANIATNSLSGGSILAFNTVGNGGRTGAASRQMRGIRVKGCVAMQSA